jgi:ribosomal protein S18 acetylase RimI-like enzyme
MWRTLRLTSQTEIAAFLRQERLYAAYALGDLEPELFPQSDWFGAEREGVLQTLAMIFKGMSPPALFVMGDPDGLALLLGLALHEPTVMCTIQSQHLPALRTHYRVDDPCAMWRMAVHANTFKAQRSDVVRRLYPGDARQLEVLYDQARTQPGEEIVAFTPSQVAQGVFYGVRDKGTLVAAAGTHLVAHTRRLAAVGNVFTLPDHRAQGHATACTSAVTAELLAGDIVDVVLNVAQANAPAIRIYEQLGYAIMAPFLECLAVRESI